MHELVILASHYIDQAIMQNAPEQLLIEEASRDFIPYALPHLQQTEKYRQVDRIESRMGLVTLCRDFIASVNSAVPPAEFLATSNSDLYYQLSKTISAASFQDEQQQHWPVSDLSSQENGLRAQASIRPPDELTLLDEHQLAEWRETIYKSIAEMDDVTADVMDIVFSSWMQQTTSSQSTVAITCDDILRERGIKPVMKKGAKEDINASLNYRAVDRKDVAKHVALLDRIFVTVQEMEFEEKVGKKMKKSKWRGESKAVIVTARAGRVLKSEQLDCYAWLIRPGDVFVKYLLGPGKGTALLSKRAVEYDPYRFRYEKRLTRFFAYRLQHAGSYEFRVRELIEAISFSMDERYPARGRERFEAILDRLHNDKVIGGWFYSKIDESRLTGRNWVEEWKSCVVSVLGNPQLVSLAPPEPRTPVAEEEDVAAFHKDNVLESFDDMPVEVLRWMMQETGKIQNSNRKPLSSRQLAALSGVPLSILTRFLRGVKISDASTEKIRQWIESMLKELPHG